jgi:hypothetical protein
VHQRDNARIGTTVRNHERRALGAAVIDDDNHLYFETDRRDDRQDRSCRAVRRDDDAIHRWNPLTHRLSGIERPVQTIQYLCGLPLRIS